VGGQFDPVVAPEWSEGAATTLDTSFVYRVPGMGHSPVLKSSCGETLAAAFFDQPHQAPEDCTTSLTGLPFMTPDRIVPTPAVYRLNTSLANQRNQSLLWLGWCIFAMASTVIAMGWMVRVWHTCRGMSRTTGVVAGLAAILHLAFMLGFALTVQRTRTTDPIMLGFGLPASASPLLLLPLIASTCSVALLGLMVWLWIKRLGTMRTRLFYTLSTVTLVGYTF
jgi:hypothetical protein